MSRRNQRKFFAELVKDKVVAIVGRAGSLHGSGNGRAIDAADVVIRINWLLPTPKNQWKDTGRKTDLVYHCKRARTAKAKAEALGVATYRVSGKRRKREARTHFDDPNLFRPTTGMVCILETLRANPKEIRLFGFDFFRTGHVQERMPETDDYSKPLRWDHNPDEERKALKQIIRRNPRIIPDAILIEALK
jgi:hypothetical protein